MNNTLIIEGEIIRYIANAMHDNLEGNAFVSYDATEVKVINPENLKNKSIIIYHSQTTDSISIWTKTGAIIKFSVDKMLIENDYFIFSSGLQDVEIMDE